MQSIIVWIKAHFLLSSIGLLAIVGLGITVGLASQRQPDKLLESTNTPIALVESTSPVASVSLVPSPSPSVALTTTQQTATPKLSPTPTPSSTPTPQPSPSPTSSQPILQNLGFSIDGWNRSTNRAGDLVFDRDILFDDSRVSSNKPFFDFGQTDKYNPTGKWIEYWFVVPLGTKVKAPVDGIASVVYFDHTQDWGINIASSKTASWQVSFEHMVNLTVADGTIVKAGDIVGEAAPRNTYSNKYAMTELAVWKADQNITKYCPYDFLADNLKPVYRQKLTDLAKDWEEFLGQDVYQEDQWVSPGCLVSSIVER